MAFKDPDLQHLFAKLERTKLVSENEISKSNLPRLVVAIDFGTYASGYAFQWRTDYENDRLCIHFNKKWPQHPTETFKTPSCLLLKNKKLHSFGYEAEKMFANYQLKQSTGKHLKQTKYYYFRYFKMMLHNNEDLNENTEIEDICAADRLPAILVFTESIRYMKNHFEQKLLESGLPKIESETQWVLTVPAIWNDAAKQLMRRAAENAGIPGQNLIIALEPEAAAIYCNQIPRNQLEIETTHEKLKYIAEPGSKVMVVDMGGGTVDITVVEIEQSGYMKQVFESGGGAWGGMKVNDNFVHMMHKIVGTRVWESFAQDSPLEEYEMRMEVETQKRTIGSKKTRNQWDDDDDSSDDDDDNDFFHIKLPASLMEKWKTSTGQKVEDALKKISDPTLRDRVEFSHSRLRFDSTVVHGLFEDVLVDVFRYITQVLDDCEKNNVKLDAMILVGGFAESSIVINTLRRMLDGRIPVVRPQSPEKAVLCGAVLFGQDKKIITSRILRLTYGVGMCMECSPSEKYPAEYIFEENGKQYVNGVFRRHATRGQEVKVNQWISDLEYFPMSEVQPETLIHIYTSQEKSPQYIFDKSCHFLGTLTVKDLRPGILNKKKSMAVSMNFGGTELKVKAEDNNDKAHKFQTTLNLLPQKK